MLLKSLSDPSLEPDMADRQNTEETGQFENSSQEDTNPVNEPWHDVFETENVSSRLHGLHVVAPSESTTEESTLPYSQAPPDIISDAQRVHTVKSTAGYRDGISVSKEKFIQEGFDEGFLLGAEIGLAVGYIHGCMEHLQASISK